VTGNFLYSTLVRRLVVVAITSGGWCHLQARSRPFIVEAHPGPARPRREGEMVRRTREVTLRGTQV
jgi:hypothetical protein